VLVLVVDSSTPAVTAALVNISANDSAIEMLAEKVTVDARAHGELLAPAIAEVLNIAGAAVGDLAAIVAGVGPGPFTGLRVGLVSAVAFGQALGLPTYGVCSLDALGYGRPGRVLVATDARRKEIYWAVYADGVPIKGPDVGRPETVGEQAGAFAVERAVGDGALRYEGVLGLPVVAEPRYPPASAFASLAAQRVRDRAESEPLHPLYLRRPDAALPGERKPVLR
jgi:tRNA threonylcarbamoyl adenosine modification protein YeaZ